MDYEQLTLNSITKQLKKFLLKNLAPSFVRENGSVILLKAGAFGVGLEAGVWGEEVILNDNFFRYISYGEKTIYISTIEDKYQHTGRAEMIQMLSSYVCMFILAVENVKRLAN